MIRPCAAEAPLRWRIVVLIGLAWAGLSIASLGVDRFPTWDEAVYWAKAAGPPNSIAWLDHRSLGVPVMLSPATVLTDSFVVVRVFVVVCLSAMAGVGLRMWSHVLPARALIGSSLFLLGWPALFHATEFFPNLPTALLLWGALGAAWAQVVCPTRETSVAVVVLQAAAVLFRPADAVWVGIGVIAIGVLDRQLRSRIIAVLRPLIVGSTLGVTPWVIESFVIFGDPLARLAGSKAEFDQYTMADPIGEFHRGLAGGPTNPDPTTLDLQVAAVWAVGLLMLAVLGAVISDGDERGARLALGAGLVAGAAYVVFPLIPDPRMLLPAMAMLSVPAGVALGRLTRWTPGSMTIAVIVAAFATWSVGQGRWVVAQEIEATGDLLAVADAIRADAGERSCAIESRYGFPQLELRTGCRAARTLDLAASTDPEPILQELDLAPGAFDVEYVVWLGEVEPPVGWRLVSSGPTRREWSILTRG